MPDEFIEKVVSFSYYLKQINCDPFFFLSKKTIMLEISLDNPDEEQIPVLTDHYYFLVLRKKTQITENQNFFGQKYIPEYARDYYSLPWYEEI